MGISKFEELVNNLNFPMYCYFWYNEVVELRANSSEVKDAIKLET